MLSWRFDGLSGSPWIVFTDNLNAGRLPYGCFWDFLLLHVGVGVLWFPQLVLRREIFQACGSLCLLSCLNLNAHGYSIFTR